MSDALQLTTGDPWDEAAGQPVVGAWQPQRAVPEDTRRTAGYIGQFRKRETPLRLIRMKCCSCMGGEPMTLLSIGVGTGPRIGVPPPRRRCSGCGRS